MIIKKQKNKILSKIINCIFNNEVLLIIEGSYPFDMQSKLQKIGFTFGEYLGGKFLPANTARVKNAWRKKIGDSPEAVYFDEKFKQTIKGVIKDLNELEIYIELSIELPVQMENLSDWVNEQLKEI